MRVWVAAREPCEPQRESDRGKNEQQHWCSEHDGSGPASECIYERFADSTPEWNAPKGHPSNEGTDDARHHAKHRGIPRVVANRRGRSAGHDLAEAGEHDAKHRTGDGTADGEPELQVAPSCERGIENRHKEMLVGPANATAKLRANQIKASEASNQ